MKAHPRAVEFERASFSAIIESDREATRDTDDELMQVTMRMSAPCGPNGKIVDVEDPRDREGDMVITLQERKVAARILNFRKLDQPAIVNRQIGLVGWGFLLPSARSC